MDHATSSGVPGANWELWIKAQGIENPPAGSIPEAVGAKGEQAGDKAHEQREAQAQGETGTERGRLLAAAAPADEQEPAEDRGGDQAGDQTGPHVHGDESGETSLATFSPWSSRSMMGLGKSDFMSANPRP